MRRSIIGLALAVLGAAALATAVSSAPKKPEPITDAQRKQGMAEAPAIAAAAGVKCKVTDARFVAKGQPDPKTKVTTSYYEVDCDQGPGFVLVAPSGDAKPSAFSCIEVNFPATGQPSNLTCMLPGNADPKSDIAPLLAKANVTCTPEAVKGIGQTANNTFFEVACTGGGGYVLQTTAPITVEGAVVANDCLLFDQGGGNIKCTIHDAASRLAVVDTYVKAANNGCVIKDKRFVGMAQSGSTFYEASCQDGKGFMYKVDKGQFSQAYPCEKASTIMGGCELVNAKEAETAQAGLYTKLAKAAGFNCDVSKYAPFPSADPSKDIVELACSNRPDGAVGVFGATAATSTVYDCARAPIVGYKCSFTTPKYDAVTADLKKMGKDSCAVSAVRVVGKTAGGTTLLETACADGLKGYILEYGGDLAPKTVTGCAFTKDCKLPGNV